ncbi:MAG: hypothetical protein ACOC5T_08315 [Elusimicrobiota bacterium]
MATTHIQYIGKAKKEIVNLKDIQIKQEKHIDKLNKENTNLKNKLNKNQKELEEIKKWKISK